MKQSGCVSNHSLREIGSLLLNNNEDNFKFAIKCLNPLLVKRSGCVSNHSLREIGSLLLNKGIVKRREPNGFVLIPLNRVIVIEYIHIHYQ